MNIKFKNLKFKILHWPGVLKKFLGELARNQAGNEEIGASAVDT